MKLKVLKVHFVSTEGPVCWYWGSVLLVLKALFFDSGGR